MRRNRLQYGIILGLFLAFIGGCGVDGQAPESVSTTMENSTMEETTIEETTIEETTEEAQGQEGLSIQDISQKTLADCSVTVYEDDALKIDYIEVLTQTGEVDSTISVTKYSEQYDTIHLENVSVNGTYSIDRLSYREMMPGDTFYKSCDYSGDPIENMQAVLVVFDSEYKEIFREQIEWNVPDTLQPARVFLPFRHAMAKSQVLCEKESARVSLIAFGQDVSEMYGDEGNLRLVLQVDNLGAATIPVKLDGVKVNGRQVEFFGTGTATYLGAGYTCFINAAVTDVELDDNDIKGISEVEVQFVTDEEENTGFHNMGIETVAGGTWYPIVLTQAEEAGEADSGKTVYEDDSIRIAYLGYEAEFNRYDENFFEEGVWNLIIENKTEENLQILGEDYTFAGEEIPDKSNHTGNKVLLNCVIGAKGSTLTKVTVTTSHGIEPEYVTMKVRVLKQGGGDLIYSLEEELRFEPE